MQHHTGQGSLKARKNVALNEADSSDDDDISINHGKKRHLETPKRPVRTPMRTPNHRIETPARRVGTTTTAPVEHNASPINDTYMNFN
jgi:hypothetical protein